MDAEASVEGGSLQDFRLSPVLPLSQAPSRSPARLPSGRGGQEEPVQGVSWLTLGQVQRKVHLSFYCPAAGGAGGSEELCSAGVADGTFDHSRSQRC